ncbi:YeeE/YedE family protein [Vibrio agarivorans]|uniref:YeeE/YedE family protein n=1 Tax=Vibrio agarivorans TaxID=153622 RepID=UPI002232228C|nr:YeeE/YedE family protein [Vibrio agarivorans]
MKPNFLFSVSALSAGLLFGLGMSLSGMIDPDKVIGFLDLAGEWDPSLAFVMGGALAVFVPGYQLLIKPRSKPVAAESFSISIKRAIDKPLIGGAVLFGLGWGLSGICPGPAITSLSFGNGQMLLFVLAMVGGSLLVQKVQK